MSKQAVAALADEIELAKALISSLTGAEWELGSDCAGWRVQDVVAHMGAVYKSIGGGPVATDPANPGKAERGADAGVNERRGWTSAQVADEYLEWCAKGHAALAGMNDDTVAATVIPLGDLGEHPMHILANAIVFDHYCHLRWDLLKPHGPLVRPALPSDAERLTPILEWMLGGLPQMCAAGLEVVDRPLNLVFEGPGGGTWTVRPGRPFVTITPGRADDAAATATSTAHDFVCWGTARRPWRAMGVHVSGDEAYAASVLDAVNVI